MSQSNVYSEDSADTWRLPTSSVDGATDKVDIVSQAQRKRTLPADLHRWSANGKHCSGEAKLCSNHDVWSSPDDSENRKVWGSGITWVLMREARLAQIANVLRGAECQPTSGENMSHLCAAVWIVNSLALGSATLAPRQKCCL
jgi:hypothetical protein